MSASFGPIPPIPSVPDGSFGESTTIMEGTGRKRKRYNTFRASSNPLPPKRSLRRHIKTSVSAIQRCNEPKSTTDSESRSSRDESFVLTADKNLEVTFQDHRSTDYLDLLEENSGVEISDELPSFPVHETSLQHGHKFQDLEFVYIDQDETDSQMNDYEVVSEITATDANKSDTPIEDDDPPVYPSCPLRLSESVLLIMTLAIRHKLTGEALADVIKLIDLHCIPGTQNCSVKTLRELKSYFVNSKEKLDLFYYCNCCFGLITTECTVCPICNTDLSSSSAKKYFVVLPIEHQLSKFFSREGFYEDLLYRFTRPRNEGKDSINDVYDGWQYQKLFCNGGVLSKQNNLSFKVNTDGVPIFKSSGFSLWPIYFEINELSPRKRRQVNNMVMGGLWFGEHKPVMRTFLKPFQEALSSLENEGIDLQLPNKETIRSHVYLISGVLDLLAKNIVLEQIQFNGFSGCSYCVEAGTSVKSSEGGRGHVHVYPFNNQSTTGHAKLRTHEDTIANGMKSLEDPCGKPVFGVKGVCQFAKLRNFDVVDGVAVDYMHGILLGVSKQLLKLWLDSKFSDEDWYCGSLIGLIDERLLSIKPPNSITRVPRSLEHHRKYWKASELRSWLFHYSLPCLTGILPEKYLHHYLLLVKGVWLLNQECISREDLVYSNFCLLKFVLYFDGLYGERHMSMNVHNLLHVKRSVEQLGPLWANSSFEFEDANGELKSMFHGSQNIDMQIVTTVAAMQCMPDLSKSLEKDSPAAQFYSKLKFGVQGKLTPIGQDIFKLGAASKCTLDENVKAKLLQVLGMTPFGTVRKFNRIKIGREVLHGKAYARVSKRNSYTVVYNKQPGQVESYGHVQFFILHQPPCCHRIAHSCQLCVPTPFAVIQRLEREASAQFVDPESDIAVNHIEAVKKPQEDKVEVIKISSVKEKCVYMEFKDISHAYISRFANFIETD